MYTWRHVYTVQCSGIVFIEAVHAVQYSGIVYIEAVILYNAVAYYT